MQNAEGYRQRLSELVLRGVASEALSYRISSTAVCVEVRPWCRRGGLGGRGGAGRVRVALSWGLISGQAHRL